MTPTIEEKQTTNAGADSSPRCALATGSVIGEFAGLDKIIRECEESIRIADRLKAQGRWQAKWDHELISVNATLAHALRERDWLDGALSRYVASQNDQDQRMRRDVQPTTPSTKENS